MYEGKTPKNLWNSYGEHVLQFILLFLAVLVQAVFLKAPRALYDILKEKFCVVHGYIHTSIFF